MAQGTEVVLERPRNGRGLEQSVVSAVLRDAPFLCRRSHDQRPLEVRVNGRPVRAEPVLPPPSLSFRRRGLRGVVGLGTEALVEVFAHGLRVREAITLDELVVEGGRRRPISPIAVEGLAPRVIVDSRELEVLMARGDAREDRALRNLMAVVQRELRRLVRSELDRHRRLSLPGRLIEGAREAWSASPLPKALLGFAIAGLLAAAGWRGASSWRGWWHAPIEKTTAVETNSDASPGPEPYSDLATRYRGPEVDGVGVATTAVDISYQPDSKRPYLAALWASGIRADGKIEVGGTTAVEPYRGVVCAVDCLEVELGVDSPSGLLRLPVATGHLLDPDSVRLDGMRITVVAVATGQPAVVLEAPWSGRLRYRAGPGVDRPPSITTTWPPLPPAVAAYAREIEALPASARALAAAEFVRRRVVYDVSPGTVAGHRRARLEGVGVFDRALAVGAGDCDVQNALVAAILDHSGLPSRLAVGWIGSEGRAVPGLHAWTEYRDADGRWRAVDASGAVAATPVGAARVAHDPRESGDGRRVAPLVLPIAGVAAVLLAGVMAVVVNRRWRRSFEAGDADDVLGLLRGAALRPRDFEGIHSLFNRRMLPLLTGASISLARARELAGRGRLACGSPRTELARLAAAGGGAVLDIEHAESRTIAEAMAAVDLDRWQSLLDRATSYPLVVRVEDALAAVGEPCHLQIAAGVGNDIAVLDGAAFGLGSRACWVVVDGTGEPWRVVCELADRYPARAELVLADLVLRRKGAPEKTVAQCLAGLAEKALREASRGRS
jgi:transglutaminase-like putative cysteine protease